MSIKPKTFAGKMSRNVLGHTGLCLVALFSSVARSRQGRQTPQFPYCYSAAALLFPVITKITRSSVCMVQERYYCQGGMPNVLEKWIAGSGRKHFASNKQLTRITKSQTPEEFSEASSIYQNLTKPP